MLSDDEIIERGGTQADIDAIAHSNGACGALYGGSCDYCGEGDDSEPPPVYEQLDLVEELEKINEKGHQDEQTQQ